MEELSTTDAAPISLMPLIDGLGGPRRASGGRNGLVLNAPILYAFYPVWGSFIWAHEGLTELFYNFNFKRFIWLHVIYSRMNSPDPCHDCLCWGFGGRMSNSQMA